MHFRERKKLLQDIAVVPLLVLAFFCGLGGSVPWRSFSSCSAIVKPCTILASANIEGEGGGAASLVVCGRVEGAELEGSRASEAEVGCCFCESSQSGSDAAAYEIGSNSASIR